jgi:hypothetical protein
MRTRQVLPAAILLEAVPGVRGNGNRAACNGNPAQCLNVACQ